MRLITEFELKFPYQLSVLETYKVKHQFDIGNQIGEMTDWANQHDDETDRFKLEIEAFPMDKWIEFKQKLLMECGMPEPNGVAILEMIKDLEFYTNNKQAVDVLIGKPSGDAITNLPDRIEYRGSDSHCKACEDEKNGVKHVMAQKHTCRK